MVAGKAMCLIPKTKPWSDTMKIGTHATVLAILGLWSTSMAMAVPPNSYVSLFDGRTLDGWTVRQADNHDWSVVAGVIDCDPHGPGKGDQNLWTKKEYGDFELLVDWRIKESPYVNRNARIILPDGSYKKDDSGKEIAIVVPNTDSGVFLRGEHKSQVNIWCWPVGSGEVWGYRTDPRFSAEVHAGATPKAKADRPIGEWNTFHIVMNGDRLTVKLNGQLVIDNCAVARRPSQRTDRTPAPRRPQGRRLGRVVGTIPKHLH